MSQAKDTPDFDPDEDLFDFAGVQPAAEEPAGSDEDLADVFASFRDPVGDEELLALPSAAAAATSTPAARAQPIALPDPPAPRAERAPRSPLSAAREPEPPAPIPSAATRAPRLSRSIVAIALAVTFLNSALAVVVLRGPGSAPRPRAAEYEDAGGAERERAPDDDVAAAQAAPARREPALPEPESTLSAPQSHPTLDAAREEISRGEYASARQRVYGLLAIIDRLEDPRRGALEADCQFLIAQSLHLEALARMGDAE